MASPSKSAAVVFERCRKELSLCSRCRIRSQKPLLEKGAYPLFQKAPSQPCRVLFILEAPNRADTFDTEKGYITMDYDTDPSGRFFRELYLIEAGMHLEELYVTNSVLCLPTRKKQRHPVSMRMLRLCTDNIQRMIEVFRPGVVCPVGTVALRATRLMDNHGYSRLRDAVGRRIQWHGRTLFPLYHTGMLARVGPYGRNEMRQREDWRQLGKMLS